MSGNAEIEGFAKCIGTAELGSTGSRVDTYCIDQGSLVEIDEAVNTMLLWYADAETCLAYLALLTVG